MGRLIDEAVLLDKHAEQCGEKSCDTCRFIGKEKCASYMAIIETPTAFDIEEVVEALEQMLESLSDCGDDWFAAEKINDAIEIVKGGVK